MRQVPIAASCHTPCIFRDSATLLEWPETVTAKGPAMPVPQARVPPC